MRISIKCYFLFVCCVIHFAKYCLAAIWHILAYATKCRHFRLFFKHLFSCSHIFYNRLIIKLTKEADALPSAAIGSYLWILEDVSLLMSALMIVADLLSAGAISNVLRMS